VSDDDDDDDIDTKRNGDGHNRARRGPRGAAKSPPHKKGDCRTFAAKGTCHNGDACPYNHDTSTANARRGRSKTPKGGGKGKKGKGKEDVEEETDEADPLLLLANAMAVVENYLAQVKEGEVLRKDKAKQALAEEREKALAEVADDDGKKGKKGKDAKGSTPEPTEDDEDAKRPACTLARLLSIRGQRRARNRFGSSSTE
jgi:hypothetical protein